MTIGRPGVYVSERLLPAPVAATATADAAGACIGAFAQGPSEVTLVNSWYGFTKLFGGYNANFPATIGVGEFFKNGGTELYVRRVLGANADRAATVIEGAASAECAVVTAKQYGNSGTNLRVSTTIARTVDDINWYDVVVSQEQAGNTTSLVITDDIILEQFLNVRFDDSSSVDWAESIINGSSSYITIEVTNNEVVPIESTFPLTGVDLDGNPIVDTDYTGTFDDFLVVDRPLVMFLPEILNSKSLGETDGPGVQADLASWAATNNCFAVIDTPPATTASGATGYAGNIGAYSNAAVYYPNIYIADPLGRSASSIRLVGPAGSVAGLYLATDVATGPFKSPAGIEASIATAVATERKLTSAELDSLNSSQSPVNAIRDLPGAGVVVMGARTLLQDGTSNRYVAMRRSLIHIRKQLESITQFAIFESNDERLWARLRTSVGIFLNDYRNRGGLRGTTADDAFYIKCDAENNTSQSIANGDVNIEVGVALQYPAEFVVITLSQKTVS